MNYKTIELNNWQKKVWNDKSRYIVICAGRRSGKSFFSSVKMADFVANHPSSVVYYVAPTYVQAKNIMWERLKQLIPEDWVLDKKEDELKLYLKNNSRIELKGADTEPDRLRGVKIDFLICDEVAFFKNWDIVWNNVLRPTLVDSKGKAIFISTPNGYNFFYDMYILGINKLNSYSSYRFTSYDNNFIDKKEVDLARQELDEDTFAQEFLAEFRKYKGMVLKEFSREKNIATLQLSNDYIYYRGFDFGYAHASAAVFVATTADGILYVYDEIKQSGLTNPEFANLIKQKSAGRHFVQSFADSAAASDIKELNNYGIPTIAVSKAKSGSLDFVRYKIKKMNEKLKSQKLIIAKHCVNLIQEIENWSYKEVREGEATKEVPAKINDDLIDALSYVIVSIPEYYEAKYVKTETIETPEWVNSLPSWSAANYGYNSYLKKRWQ